MDNSNDGTHPLVEGPGSSELEDETSGPRDYSRCKAKGCLRSRLRGGYCSQHGGGKKCSHQDCKKGAAGPSDTCIAHGGGRRCEEKDCDKLVRKGGFCLTHAQEKGVSVERKKCHVDGCDKQAYKKGFCCAHARLNGFYKPGDSGMCKEEGCDKFSQKQGYCKTHGRINGVDLQARKRCEYVFCSAFFLPFIA